MLVSSLQKLLCAAHATRYVKLPGYEQRGGIFLVADPANMKSTMLKLALSNRHDALVLSDMNAQMLNEIKAEIEKENFTTISFGEFEKIYERNPATAKNLEGTLRAMVEEGFGNPSFMSPLMGETLARVLLFGGVTKRAWEKRFKLWSDSGFYRRMLWIKYTLKDKKAVGDAIERGTRIPLPDFSNRYHAARDGVRVYFPVGVRVHLRTLLREQSEETPFVLLLKIYCVLAQFEGANEALRILNDCGDCFLKNGGLLCFGRITKNKKKKNSPTKSRKAAKKNA